MQIVIDIPNGAYEELCNAQFPMQDAYRIVAWIKNGTTLPKGHGRLIDADAATKTVQTFEDAFCVCYSSTGGVTIACTAPTIIEADEEVDNE